MLVIDAQPANLWHLETVLADGGFNNVVTTTSTASALEAISEAQPDLIILEWHMEDHDGEQFLKTLRINWSTDRLPVLVVTPDFNPQASKSALVLGANGYIPERFLGDHLAQQIGNLFYLRATRGLLFHPSADRPRSIPNAPRLGSWAQRYQMDAIPVS